MKKSQITTKPNYYDRYINLADDVELVDGLVATLTLFDNHLTDLERVANNQYAPDKWTPKDIIQHVTDTERIMAYRALRIARNDNTSLPGYEEDLFAKNE